MQFVIFCFFVLSLYPKLSQEEHQEKKDVMGSLVPMFHKKYVLKILISS